VADHEQEHVFISYVRENSKEVDNLCDELSKHGVHVWLDRNKIQPGVKWKDAVRNAIRRGNFFIACFSKEYTSRDKTFMNEELTLAIDELRKYSTDRAWFIPVLLSKCDVPARNIGGGETLRDISWVALYENRDIGIQRILEVIRPFALETQNLIKALSSRDPYVRHRAVEASGKIGDPAAVPALIVALSDYDPYVRGRAGEALGKIGDPAAVPALVVALSDEDPYVRRYVAAALDKIGDPAAVPALMSALRDEDPYVRQYVAGTLYKIGDPALVPLILALSDEDP